MSPVQSVTDVPVHSRAGRWFEHYGRAAEFGGLMNQWCGAMERDLSFRQQIDPVSGVFTGGDLPSYSPAALVMMDFTWRLAGVREEANGLEWNVRPGHAAAEGASFRLRMDAGGTAELRYEADGAELRLSGRRLGRVAGGTLRLVTDTAGKPVSVVGIGEAWQRVRLELVGLPFQTVMLDANQRVGL